jgi:catechol 2,3-dioxygenase-like lactoylglutathione lyase family enzyme
MPRGRRVNGAQQSSPSFQLRSVSDPVRNPSQGQDMIMKLNHLNLCTENVADLADFFTRFFGFELVAMRGKDAFAILRGTDGFALNLMRSGKSPGQVEYPDGFHVGFLVDGADEVLAKHQQLRETGIEPGEVQKLTRGGTLTALFYCEAPGGVLVEVSAEAE